MKARFLSRTHRLFALPPRAFTLVELLVVIAIVGVLVSLLAPAVQTARDSAQRTQCGNQVRQIALALTQHAEALGVIPHNGSWDGKQTIKSAKGSPFTPATTDFAAGRTFSWGVGDPNQPPLRQPGSWLYSLLPYVEQVASHRDQSPSTPVVIYVCPSRRRLGAIVPVEKDAQGAYVGGGLAWCKADYAGNALLMPGRPDQPPRKCWRLAEVTDGLSGTILAGEKAFDPLVQTPASWYWDEPFFLGGSSGTVRDGLGLAPDRQGADFKNNWGSPHRGGVVFAFCDGSVHTIGFGTDWNVLLSLLTPSGSEPSPTL